MIFQTDIKYDKIDELVKEGMEYALSNNKEKPMKKIRDIDPFFLDFIIQNNIGTKITGGGIVCMKPGSESADPHQHQRAKGVLYLQVPEGVGSLLLQDLDEIITPHKGLFVVIPAKASHGVTKNDSNEIRLALSFNIE